MILDDINQRFKKELYYEFIVWRRSQLVIWEQDGVGAEKRDEFFILSRTCVLRDEQACTMHITLLDVTFMSGALVPSRTVLFKFLLLQSPRTRTVSAGIRT